MSILHSCSLLTSALTSSINVNTIQQIEALLNYLLCPQPCLWKLFTHFNGVLFSNSLLVFDDSGCFKTRPPLCKIWARPYTRRRRHERYFTLKNLWNMKYHLISGIFPCKYTRRYLILDLMAFSFSSLTTLNSPHYCMRRFFFLIIVVFFSHIWSTQFWLLILTLLSLYLCDAAFKLCQLFLCILKLSHFVFI